MLWYCNLCFIYHYSTLLVSQEHRQDGLDLREYDIEMVGELPPPDFEKSMMGPKGKCTVRYTKKTASAW